MSFIVRTLGPEGTTSERAAKNYLSVNCPVGEGEIILHRTFSEASLHLKLGERLLVPSAFDRASEFFFTDKLKLEECFIDRSSIYFLCAATDNPVQKLIYIHPVLKGLAGRFMEEKNLLLEPLEVESTSQAAKNSIRDNCYAIANQNAADLYNLTKLNDGYQFSMTWNVFTNGVE